MSDRLAPIPVRTVPGLTLSCAMARPETCRVCSRPATCTCDCHQRRPR